MTTATQEIWNLDGSPNPAGLIGKTITAVRELNDEERVDFKGYKGLVVFECDDQTQIFGSTGDADENAAAVGQKIVRVTDELGGELPNPELGNGAIIIVVNVAGWVSEETFDASEKAAAGK
jgi:hypothetical protein